MSVVIFDLDGVVWDLRPHVAELLDVQRSRVVEELANGGNLLGIARRHGMSVERLAASLASRSDRLVGPEVLKTLDQLTRGGCRCGAATSLSGRVARPLLEATGLDARFERVVFPARGRPAKPSPEPLLAAASDMSRPSVRHWYVGDTPSDQQAAKAAGWAFVWARYGYGPRPTGQIDAEIGQFAELLSVLGFDA